MTDRTGELKRPCFGLGLLINPYAGVGGPAAQKGSDSAAVQSAASQGQLALTAPKRAATFLKALAAQEQNFELATVAGAMGEDACRALGLDYTLVEHAPASPSDYRDTEEAAAQLAACGIDLLVFVGGDGTARDVCRVLGESQLVLGVPAGVKMHSGVYAVNPQAAAEVVKQMIAGELVNVDEREVRDIDEEAFRQGTVKSRFFGVMQVPDEVRYVQQVKQGGQEVEELVLADIAADFAERLEDDTLYIFGPGSTTHNVLKNLQWPSTLLGVDVFRDEQVLKNDASADDLQVILAEHDGPVALYITAIGGQGHILGRGNQQLSPAVLRRVGRDNIHVLATKTKLKNLAGRPLLIDTGDPELDEGWQGYIKVITGYRDTVLYRLGYGQAS
jgi:predicted polyphosphate/ATP-dependent NAD kinase